MAGRPPKPTAVKRDQGTLRKHRERGKVPEPPAAAMLPPPPADLEATHGGPGTSLVVGWSTRSSWP